MFGRLRSNNLAMIPVEDYLTRDYGQVRVGCLVSRLPLSQFYWLPTR